MIQNLILVGCGHMGRAMLAPWLSGNAARKIWVIEPLKDSVQGLDKQGAQVCAKASELPADISPDVVVFAVRPQVLEETLADYKKYTGALFLSIAAGKKLEAYTRILGDKARIVRAMPNLAAKVHEAAILLAAGGAATNGDRTIAEVLFSPLGKAFWLEGEGLMDAATALSGCGLAYFYLLADTMAKAAQKHGFTPEMAQQLARQTLIGAAEFCKREDASLEKLYQNVAVKGGMTEAAVNVLLESDALQKLMDKAITAAVERGKKLS